MNGFIRPDKKGRLVLPAAVRRMLGTEYVRIRLKGNKVSILACLESDAGAKAVQPAIKSRCMQRSSRNMWEVLG